MMPVTTTHSPRDANAPACPPPSAPPRPSPVLLALDLGSTTGWALQGRTGAIASGTAEFKPSRFEGGGMAFLRFSHWLSELNETAGPIDRVYFEEVRRHAGTLAAQIYGGFLAHLGSWAEFRDVPYQGVPVGTIKKHATGKGNADKQAMVAAMRARGFAPVDHNEADALAILSWAVDTNGGVS